MDKQLSSKYVNSITTLYVQLIHPVVWSALTPGAHVSVVQELASVHTMFWGSDHTQPQIIYILFA